MGPAGVAAEVVDRVAARVLATAGHAAEAPDARLLIDVDLAILGVEPEAYARFEEQIRQEYAWVPDDRFRAGRAEVLRRFA